LQDAGVLSPTAEDEAEAPNSASPQELKTQSGCGGAWRAFISEATSRPRGSPDFAALSRELHALGDEEKAKYIELGAARTEAANCNVGTPLQFRVSARQAERSAKKLRSQNQGASMLNRSAALSEEALVVSHAACAPHAFQSGTTWDRRVRIEFLARAQRSNQRAMNSSAEHAIEAYCTDGHGKAMVRRSSCCLPRTGVAVCEA